jgi:hypothetical protein
MAKNGALATGPGATVETDAQPVQKKRKGGALMNGPLATTQEGLLAQQQKLQARIDKRGGIRPKLQERMGLVNNAIGGLNNQAAWDQSGQSANTALQGYLNQIQSQGAFNPGDYSAQRQKAEQTAMDAFNRNMNPQFQHEDEMFRQRMANEGIDPNSERYKIEYKNMADSQNSQRLNANTQAFQLGQGEQQQAWGQAFQGYQLPAAQAGMIAPIAQYGQGLQFQAGQTAQNFANQQKLAAQQNQYNLEQIKASPRGGGGGGGGGGLSYEEQLGLLDRSFYNNMVANGQKYANGSPGGGAANGFIAGAGQGIAMGIGQGLR